MATKVLILGASGMLGSAVGQYFNSLPDYEVWLTSRDGKAHYGPKNKWAPYDPLGRHPQTNTSLVGVMDEVCWKPDYVINCIGTIKPNMVKSLENAIKINSLLPHDLAKTCEILGVKFIHITTDCVYSGKKGNYIETDPHDALDQYGKTKSLGEPNNCMVIRTSIIGPEINNQSSLVAWAQSQAGKEVNGFKNHTWNGVSTRQYAKICQQIMEKNLYQHGLFHAFSNVVNKYELLQLINKRYALNLKINPMDAVESIDRTLSTCKDLMSRLEIVPLEQQIMEM